MWVRKQLRGYAGEGKEDKMRGGGVAKKMRGGVNGEGKEDEIGNYTIQISKYTI